MKGSIIRTEDRSRFVWDAWFQLRLKCGHFAGMDGGGRGLCNHDKNEGTVEQERGCKRCGLPFCHFKGAVEKSVQKRIATNAQAKDIIPAMESTPVKSDSGNVIDLSSFVSADALNYEQTSV